MYVDLPASAAAAGDRTFQETAALYHESPAEISAVNSDWREAAAEVVIVGNLSRVEYQAVWCRQVVLR